jgi:hypothetical protein
VILATWVGAGCAPDVTESVPDAAVRADAAPRNPEGTHHPFVIDSITVPTSSAEAQQMGLDVDHDDEVDNALGSIVALLSANGADLNATISEQIAVGTLIHLTDLQTNGFDDADAVALYVWKGGNPSPEPCLDQFDDICRQHLSGTGSFDGLTDAPQNAMIFGEVTAAHYGGGGGSIELEVPLFISDTALHLKLVAARAEVDVAETGLTEGHLAGAVTSSFLESNVIPELHVILNIVVERDCTGTYPDCCIPDTDGDVAVGLFDSDHSCTLTLAELQDSAILDSLLTPDVDVLDGEGFEGQDGVLDSVSLGVLFSAVPAIYETPPGL